MIISSELVVLLDLVRPSSMSVVFFFAGGLFILFSSSLFAANESDLPNSTLALDVTHLALYFTGDKLILFSLSFLAAEESSFDLPEDVIVSLLAVQ